MSTNDKLNVHLKTVITETHEVELSVNGSSKGTRKINGGPSLLEFCQEAAREFGVNTFEITVDGSPVSPKTAAKPIYDSAPSGSRVGVVAQNSRGTDPEQPAAPTGDSALIDPPENDDDQGDEDEDGDTGDEQATAETANEG